MRLRALCVAVLAAALAIAHANLSGNLRALGELKACASDADCSDARASVCLTNGECGGPRSRLACSGDQPCGPGDDKLCLGNVDCEGNARCRRNSALGYRTCTCPKNQQIVDLNVQSFCDGADENNDDDDEEEEEGPVMTPGASVARMGCGCPAGTFRERNGRCVPSCCPKPLRAQPGNACPQVCGQTLNCDADALMQTWDGGDIMGARCNCPRYRPVFDPVRKTCVAHEGFCDARNAQQECPGELAFMLKQPCPQVCNQPDYVCSAGDPSSGCGCPDASKPIFNPATGACVATRDQCKGEEEPPPPPTPTSCQSPLVYFEHKPCQHVCGQGPQMCTQAVEPGCACPVDKPKFDPETGGCVDECPGEDDDDDDEDDDDDDEEEEEKCTGNRIWYDVQKACEQVCGEEPVFCAAVLEAGCACAEGELWSRGAERCVKPTECDARRL